MSPSLFRGLLSVLLGGTLLLRPSAAAEFVQLHAWRSEGWVVVDVRAKDLLDPRTRSTVESGLPGAVSLSLVLETEGDGNVAERLLHRDLELDLWEGSATVQDEGGTRSYDGLAAADSAWSRFAAVRLAPTNSLASEARYRVRGRLWVRPLGADDRQRIARWVTRGADADGRDVRLDVGRLLKHFVGEGEDDSDEGAVRRDTPYFYPSELSERGLQP